MGLLRSLRARPETPRAAAPKNSPSSRQSKGACPLRKTIRLSLAPGLREARAKFKLWRTVRPADSSDHPIFPVRPFHLRWYKGTAWRIEHKPISWTSQTIGTQSSVYVGLAVTSGNTAALSTATFDTVVVTTPEEPRSGAGDHPGAAPRRRSRLSSPERGAPAQPENPLQVQVQASASLPS